METDMATRAKMKCVAVEDYGFSKKVKLSVVYAPDANGEDANFTKATPNGELWMTIDNPKASTQFEPNGIYYVDIHQCGRYDPMTGQTLSFD
jgi:hypothetical protein